jgi:glycosyltransferase involved in cell wall biosynthesis
MSDNENKVVCHITSVHTPFDVRIFHKQCKTLSNAGFSVFLVATDDKDDVVKDGVNLAFVNLPRSRFERVFFTSLLTVLRALKEKPDVIQMHDPELLPYALILAIIGKKIVFDFHEDVEMKLLEREWLPKPFRSAAAMIFRSMAIAGGRLFSAKLTATPTIAAHHTGNRIEVIANYPVPLLIEGDLSDNIYRESNNNIIYTGGWTHNRGIQQLVKAMEHVNNPSAKLTVIGQVEPDEHAIASQFDGYTRVIDVGRVPYEDSVKHMQEAALGLVCSQYGHGYDKALPNKLFEYMALGLPVIASNFPLWVELLENEDCVVFVDPAKPAEIAQAIDSLLTDCSRREVMGTNGRRAIKERFSWEQEGKRLVKIYDEILQC